MPPHPTARLVIAFALATLGGAPEATATADPRPLACGDTITADTRLTADLVDCPHAGLVIGADGVSLDLNGHRVDGDASGDDVGLDVEGRHGVTIAGGTVRDFAEGVFVAGASGINIRRLTSAAQAHGGITVDGSRGVVITDSVVRGSGAGIIVTRSALVRVDGNRVSASAFGGIPVFDSQRVVVAGNRVTTSLEAGVGLFDGSSHSEVSGNALSRNGAGVSLDAGASENLVAGNAVARNASGVIVDVGAHGNRVVENTIQDSAFEGIAVVGSDGNLIARNRVARNGALDIAGGIVIMRSPDDPTQTSDANVISDNTALDNRGDGIAVRAGQTANVLRGDRADRNSLLGIDASPGSIDGGGNHAAHNGDARQCVGVACQP